MNPLPYIYVTWDESAEPLATFLRYQVYRREQSSPAEDWTKIATIGDRSNTSYQDFAASSGVTLEYAVTVVATATSGEEVESDFPAAVSTTLTIRSFFIHPVGSPELYVEIKGSGSEFEAAPDVVLVQPWGRRLPTAHFGPQLGEAVRVSATRAWGEDQDVWQALYGLLELQRESGPMLLLRGYRDYRVFGSIMSAPRTDNVFNTWETTVEFVATHYEEAVP